MTSWIHKTFNGNALRHFWLYHDAQSQIIGAVARYDRADGGKEVIPYFKPAGEFFSVGAHEKPRPLFGLEILDQAAHDRAVIVVEGEKCAAALQSLGLVCITWQGGAKQVATADWTALEGRKHVFLLPDNDEVGRTCMNDLTGLLAALSNPPKVQLGEIPGLPEGGDVVDVIHGLLPSWSGFDPIPDQERETVRAHTQKLISTHAKPASAQKEKGPASGGVREQGGRVQKVVPIPLTDFMNRDVKKRPAILGSWFLAGMPVLLAGLPGCGKSLFAYTIAVALASGGEAFGWKASRPLRVGILDGEMFDETIIRRLGQIIKGMGIEFDPTNIKLFSRDMCADSSAPFPNLRFPEERQELLRNFMNIDVLIVDNINTLFPGGDERGTQFWTPVEEFIFDCRGLGVAPVLVHHTTKTTPGSPAGSSKNVRVCEISVVLTGVDSDTEGAHFNIGFAKTRELTQDTSPRSARACVDVATNALTWKMGPYIDSDEGRDNWAGTAKDMRAAGSSIGDIAEALGKSKSTVHKTVNERRA